jgi:hypothetical protein
LFDPDPQAFTGSITGFAQYGAIYNNYKVLGVGYIVKIASRESTPLQVVVAPTLSDIGLNSAQVQQLPEVPYGRSSIISTQGGMDNCVITGKIDLTALVGKQYLYDATYAGTYNSNPQNNIYLNVGFACLNGLTNGVITDIRLFYHVLWYNRRDIFA